MTVKRTSTAVKCHLSYLNDTILLLKSTDDGKFVESFNFIEAMRCGTFDGDNGDNDYGGNGDYVDGDDGDDDYGYATTEFSYPPATEHTPNRKRISGTLYSFSTPILPDSFAHRATYLHTT